MKESRQKTLYPMIPFIWNDWYVDRRQNGGFLALRVVRQGLTAKAHEVTCREDETWNSPRGVWLFTTPPHRLQPARLLSPWDSPGRNTGADSRALLQGIFLAQGSNPGLLHCRQILYRLTTGAASDVLRLDCGDDCSVNVLKALRGKACDFHPGGCLVHSCPTAPSWACAQVHVVTKAASWDCPWGCH